MGKRQIRTINQLTIGPVYRSVYVTKRAVKRKRERERMSEKERAIKNGREMIDY